MPVAAERCPTTPPHTEPLSEIGKTWWANRYDATTTTPHTAPAGTEPEDPSQEPWVVPLPVGPERQEEGGYADGHRRHQGQVPWEEEDAARNACSHGDEAHDVLRDEEVSDAFDVVDDRRPSASTDGRCENLPSSSTSCAIALVACAPLFIATPMSASFASASLRRRRSSHDVPVGLQRVDEARFVRTHPPEDLSPYIARTPRRRYRWSGVAQPASGMSRPTRRRSRRRSAGCRRDLDVHPAEEVQRVLGVGPHLLGQGHQGEERIPGAGPAGRAGLTVPQGAPPAARSSPCR